MAKTIAGLTKEELLANLTPFEILTALIEEDDSLLFEETPIKAAARALTDAQTKKAGRDLLREHVAKVYAWRAAHGWPPIILQV